MFTLRRVPVFTALLVLVQACDSSSKRKVPLPVAPINEPLRLLGTLVLPYWDETLVLAWTCTLWNVDSRRF
ncbi:hypothetical protein QBC35DRAFT_503298 [Podospora australis]|uniref:Uncharacterized protein n=1 Tax=Podospora australis TaxID=1536484 RepID=A0AAN7AEH7_9PEZI|nr:hypothetical protein QBC35DRAFT_503298 [Podospora australis]